MKMKPIPIETIKQQMRQLRLKDMAEYIETALELAQKQKQGHLEFVAQLMARQIEATAKRSVERRINTARLPPNMTFDNFDWGFQPGLNVEYLKNLKTLTFVANHQPLLILGKTGTGKTHMAAALGVEACEAGFRVGFFKLQQLLFNLYATLADDTTEQAVAKLARLDLLIIDHIGYIRNKDEYPSLLLDLICACQDRVSLIVTTSISLEQWGVALGNVSITNDIADRLFHNAGVINIRPGRSYRTEGPNAPKLSPPEDISF
jgi:DNA replication protein DnaC